MRGWGRYLLLERVVQLSRLRLFETDVLNFLFLVLKSVCTSVHHDRFGDGKNLFVVVNRLYCIKKKQKKENKRTGCRNEKDGEREFKRS